MMRKYHLVLLVLFGAMSVSSVSPSSVQETMRRWIENHHNAPFKVLGETIYCTTALPAHYQKSLYQVVWDSSMRLALLNVLELANEEGLNASDYHTELLRNYSHKTDLTTTEQAGLELIATDAFLLYSSHLIGGKVNPETIGAEWHVVRRGGDPVELLNRVVDTKQVKEILTTILPQQAVYVGLKTALKQYIDIVKGGGWEPVALGETLKRGMDSERIVQLRKRLVVTGDLAERDALTTVFDERLEIAVKNFQGRLGLFQDGEVGQQTLAALNVSAAERMEQVRLNMERWRWLPNHFSSYYIKVNIADFTLEVIKNGKIEKKHKVIVGKSYRKTPVFSSKMTYLVLNPTWTVPSTILTNDILPAVRKDVNYLKNKNLTVYDSRGNKIDPLGANWSTYNLRSFTYMQAPGPDNALGVVKFMFPNAFSVYLHDTPAKELFEKSERSFSSGCVRVQHPLLLAEYLIGNAQQWNLEKINDCISKRTPTTIPLKEQPEVYLLYWTAWIAENGTIHFRKDIYDRDAALKESLNTKAPKV
jgi:murein L,D-transpeptidase YcbB/YkuD